MGKRGIFSKLMLSVVASALTLVLAVGGLELVSAQFVQRPADLLIADWRLHHAYGPHSTVTHEEWAANNPRFTAPYTQVHNAQGWSETYDVEVDKPAGTYRIFYVGDSFTEGTAPMEGSMPAQVETELKRRFPGRDLEVINTGTASYSPLIEYVLIRYVLMDYEPDLVVLNVDMTDDFDDWKYHPSTIYDDAGNPLIVQPRDGGFIDTEAGAVRADFGMRLQLFLYRHSYTYQWLVQRAPRQPADAAPAVPAAQSEPDLYRRWRWCQDDWDEFTEANAARTLDMIGRIARYCAGQDVKLMITSVPHFLQFSHLQGPEADRAHQLGHTEVLGERQRSHTWSRRPHEEIARVARQEGVPYLDSLRALEPVLGGTRQTDYYYYMDMHFNPDGYTLWAEAQVAFLTDPENGLLPAEWFRDG